MFSAGYENNVAAGVSLEKALLHYRSNLDSLSPVEEGVEVLQWHLLELSDFTRTADDVHAISDLYDSVRLSTLGSASRGIPRKEWSVPLPFVPLGYALGPGVDVIAFVTMESAVCVCCDRQKLSSLDLTAIRSLLESI